MRKILVTGVCLAAVLNVSACQTMDKDDAKLLGTVGGGIGGAILGAQFGKGAGQLVATALGAVAGSLLGNWLADRLTQEEQATVAVKGGQALDGAADGETVSWTAPESGTQVALTPRETTKATRKVTIVRDKNIAAPPAIEVLGETWQAKTGANLRAAPSASAEKVGGLRAGERFQAIARVVGDDWIMVGRNNRTIGYIHASLVQKAPQAVAAATAPAVAGEPAVTDARQGLTASRDLDTLLAGPAPAAGSVGAQQQTASVDLDSMGLVADEVEATTTCRTLDVAASKGGESGNNTMQACRAQDGMWEIL